MNRSYVILHIPKHTLDEYGSVASKIPPVIATNETSAFCGRRMQAVDSLAGAEEHQSRSRMQRFM